MAANKFPPIGKMSNEELRRFGMEELIYLLRQIDGDRLNTLREHSNLMRDINKRMQTHLMEIRSLKDVNQKLQDENQEVRDLACFLDDDRQKGRKLAREWQRFGRYTSSVMKSELTTYQQKLKDLEEKQDELLKENIELKELCIYLDQELKRYQRGDSIDRDAGDGSSSSSPTGEKVEETPGSTAQYVEAVRPVTINEQTAQYIRHLEQQVQVLEQAQQKSPTSTQPEFRKYFSTPQLSHGQQQQQQQQQQQDHTSHNPPSRPESVMQAMKVLEVHEQLEGGGLGEPADVGLLDEAEKAIPPSRPESVMQAMKVLEVHEQLEGGGLGEPADVGLLDEAEKAIVRQMCNVVWKKLGET